MATPEDRGPLFDVIQIGTDVVVIHTDGGCRPNPGPGGWGAVLRHREHVREMCGGDSGVTSNNRMELTAAIQGLTALKEMPIAEAGRRMMADELATKGMREAIEASATVGIAAGRMRPWPI